MNAWIARVRESYHWQAACLADDIRRIWRRLWLGKPGRHGTWQDYNTGQMAAIETDLATRPWLALEPAPAQDSPAPGPELFHDWAAEAELRATSPHVYAPDPDYWTYAWTAFREDFADSRAWDEDEANELRAECGLPPRQFAIAAGPLAEVA